MSQRKTKEHAIDYEKAVIAALDDELESFINGLKKQNIANDIAKKLKDAPSFFEALKTAANAISELNINNQNLGSLSSQANELLKKVEVLHKTIDFNQKIIASPDKITYHDVYRYQKMIAGYFDATKDEAFKKFLIFELLESIAMLAKHVNNPKLKKELLKTLDAYITLTKGQFTEKSTSKASNAKTTPLPRKPSQNTQPNTSNNRPFFKSAPDKSRRAKRSGVTIGERGLKRQ